MWLESIVEIPFQNHKSFELRRDELIHGDICEPIQPSTLAGRRYYLLVVDDFSRLMWGSFSKSKIRGILVF